MFGHNGMDKSNWAFRISSTDLERRHGVALLRWQPSFLLTLCPRLCASFTVLLPMLLGQLSMEALRNKPALKGDAR